MDKKLQFKTLPSDPSLAEKFDIFMCNDFNLPSFANKFLKENADEYEAREDDIYVVSYPKTGTTWLQEIVYLIHSDLDFERAKSLDMGQRFPYVEHSRTDFNFVKNMESPRLLKSHLPFSLLPQDIHRKHCKILYITRNPRDVAVSYFHFACMLKETAYKGTFEQYFGRFIQDRPTYGPFFLHNLEFWNNRSSENILFLFYEDLKKDFSSSLKRISEFLNKNLEEEDIKAITDYCNFKNMSTNKSVALSKIDSVDDKPSNFFRKGEVGDWKNYLNADMVSRLDQKMKEELKDSDLKYTYEL